MLPSFEIVAPFKFSLNHFNILTQMGTVAGKWRVRLEIGIGFHGQEGQAFIYLPAKSFSKPVEQKMFFSITKDSNFSLLCQD